MNLSLKLVFILMAVLLVLCLFLFITVICIKLIQARQEKAKLIDKESILPILDKLLSMNTVEFFKNNEQNILKMEAKLKGKSSIQTLEDVLLETLENAEGETRVRVHTIAYHFGFPGKCLSMINDRLTGNIAIGCRKAGFYQADEAIPGIMNALNIFSSNTQNQALMALARIGNTEIMIDAFNKIHNLIFVNERAINEMLNTFSGDRYTLFKTMIHHKSDYLARLFMKAIDKGTAAELIEDIILLFERGAKETRLACIVAIGKSGDAGKTPILIEAMHDLEWEIRAMAAKTLGVLVDPAAVAPLTAAAGDREWWVRQNAVTSILAYSNRDEILESIAKTGDRYAYDSMLYTLEKTNETALLERIKGVWPEAAKTSMLLEDAV